MSFTNINDPAGVKSLLEQLRTSQAWQDTVEQAPAAAAAVEPVKPAEAPTASKAPAGPPVISHDENESHTASSTVASLLSQLQASRSWSSFIPAPPPSIPETPKSLYVQPPSTLTTGDNASSSSAAKPSPSHQDVRSFTFQQALPRLAELADDSSFVQLLSEMKQRQADLEKQLWGERQAILAKHQERVKIAQAKAKIFGGGISQHEADMMTDACGKELKKFDTERVVIAWDALLTKQQTALEIQRVPAMFITDVKADRERQQRIIQVLEGISDTGHV